MQINKRKGFGGFVTAYKVEDLGDLKIEIKNIGRGRLVTDYCKNCKHFNKCGEGIYALRSGVDALWKPCLLNQEKYEKMEGLEDGDFKPHILSMIHKMVGDWKNHYFHSGNPS